MLWSSMSSPDLSRMTFTSPWSTLQFFFRPWCSWLSSQGVLLERKSHVRRTLTFYGVWDRTLLLSHGSSQLALHRELLCHGSQLVAVSSVKARQRFSGWLTGRPWLIPSPHQGILSLSLFHGPLLGLFPPERPSGGLAYALWPAGKTRVGGDGKRTPSCGLCVERTQHSTAPSVVRPVMLHFRFEEWEMSKRNLKSVPRRNTRKRSKAQWPISVIPALWKVKQEDGKFEASLGYKAKPTKQ